MALLIDVLDSQRRQIEEVDPNVTVFEAIARMARAQIGCLVVSEDERLAGLFSERDYLQKVALRGRTSRTTVVREVMAQPTLVGQPGDDAEAVLREMVAHRVKYVPVVEHDRVIGIVTRGDLTRAALHGVENRTERTATGRYAVRDDGAVPSRFKAG